jgi:N-methylhydantoinase A
MGRLATDIGGTFTDLVYFDEDSGDLKIAKSLTTPKDLTQGVLDTIAQAAISGVEAGFFVHGGTTVINAITERKGVKTALITTAGFRDVLEIARGNRPDLYNLRFIKEAPFVPRALRFEVRERVNAKGRVLQPLRVEDLDPIIESCRHNGVEAIAILFLHSYVAPAHETACADYLKKICQGFQSRPHTRLRASGANMNAPAQQCSTPTCNRSSRNISVAWRSGLARLNSTAPTSQCSRTAVPPASDGRKNIRSR